MRFLLMVLFAGCVPLYAWAQSLIPPIKPDRKTFSDIIRHTATATQDKPDTPVTNQVPVSSITVRDDGIILPPPLPDDKRPQQNTADANHLINGIPIPLSKPFTVVVSRDRSIPPPANKGSTAANQAVISYVASEDDERTAGRRTRTPKPLSDGSERIHAERIGGRLKETRDNSPFQSAKLPKAAKQSLHDPVIVFFKEQSPELEVGQMSVLRDDVLVPLNRSTATRAIIYGYAIENRKNPEETRRLALSRAMLVREYLIDNRIDGNRLDVRTMGSDTPIEPRNRVDVVITR